MRRKRLTVTLLVAAGMTTAALIVPWVRRPAVLYEVTFLTTADGEPIIPHSINDLGQVVGLVEGPDRRQHVFLWDKSQGPQDLGSYCIEYRSSLCVNDAGQVLAQVVEPNGTRATCLLDPNGQERLRDTWNNAGHQWVTLNNRGQLAGHLWTSTGAMHAAMWDPGSGVRDLGTLGGPHSFALSINDQGQVAGVSEVVFAETTIHHTFFWDPNTGMQDLGPGSPSASPKYLPLNEKGYVAGAFAVGAHPAFISIWSQAQGLQPGPVMEEWSNVKVLALNDANQLLLQIGAAAITLGEERFHYRVKGYLWDPNEGFVPLHRHMRCRGVRAFFARDLNNKGQIVGELALRTSKRAQGVLLDPVARHDTRTCR